jgi:hypothetical protein
LVFSRSRGYAQGEDYGVEELQQVEEVGTTGLLSQMFCMKGKNEGGFLDNALLDYFFMLDIGMSGMVLRMAYRAFQSMHYAARMQFIERSHLKFIHMHTFTKSMPLLSAYSPSINIVHLFFVFKPISYTPAVSCHLEPPKLHNPHLNPLPTIQLGPNI